MSSRRGAITPAQAAWIAVVPCALLTLGAIVVLAPALGRVLFPPRTYDFWPSMLFVMAPEPTENSAFLLALTGTLALSLVVLGSSVRPLRLQATTTHRLVHASEALVCGFLAIAVIAQHRLVYDARYTYSTPIHAVYFTWTTVAVAVLLAVAAAVALGRERTRRGLGSLLHETRARRIGAGAVAVLFTALWLLTAVNVDSSVGNVNPAVLDMLPWSFAETYAILDGLTPLVDFHAQYGQLWPSLAAATLALAGSGLGVYTTAMAAIGGASLLGVFALFRRVTHSSLGALALFLPFVATSFFTMLGPPQNRYGPANLLTIFPSRYAGPYLLAWLLSRQLGGLWPRRRSPLFAVAGLVVINNPEFGIPALGAAVAACVWTDPPDSVRAAARLLGSVAAGLLGAVAAVTALTLVLAGELPRFGLLFEFARLYGVSGWAMLPMPAVGFHLVVLATFVAALTLATVRAVSHDEDRVTTGLLAWVAVFGLGAGAYFVGRSHPDVLISLFSAWALALALLLTVVVRAVAARPSHRPSAPELAVLVGCGLAVCSIAQTPTPWSQVERLADATATPAFRDNAIERFVAQDTRRGEHVVILNPGGHRTAHDLGLVNVSRYSSSEAIVTRHQLLDTIAALRAAGGTKVFVPVGRTAPEQIDTLAAAGFAQTRRDEASATIELVDRAGR